MKHSVLNRLLALGLALALCLSLAACSSSSDTEEEEVTNSGRTPISICGSRATAKRSM